MKDVFDGRAIDYIERNMKVQFHDVVLLTGAGASSIIGLPTLDQLLLSSNIMSKNTKSLEIIKEARRVIESKKHGNAVFEEIIPLLRNYYKSAQLLRLDYLFKREIGELGNNVLNGQFEKTWKDALTECFRLLIETYGPQNISSRHDGISATLKILKKIAILNGGELHLFTTNYDCTFQVIGKKLKNKLNIYSRINFENQNMFDKESWYLLNHEGPNSALPSIFIHRLHGCVAWYSNPDSISDIFEDYGAGDQIEIRDEDRLNSMDVKLIKSETEGLNPALQIEFNEFSRCIDNSKILFVWGYSFRDQEVLRIINNAFNTKKSFTVLYLDPFLSENSALNNINWTLRNVPLTISKEFKPQKIQWRPQHGYNEMVNKTISLIKKEIKKHERTKNK